MQHPEEVPVGVYMIVKSEIMRARTVAIDETATEAANGLIEQVLKAGYRIDLEPMTQDA